jgi:hypothetical protein
MGPSTCTTEIDRPPGEVFGYVTTRAASRSGSSR